MTATITAPTTTVVAGIKFTAVESSFIVGRSYNEATKVLTLAFASGAVHAYSGVSRREYDALKKSDSPGRTFNKLIKGVKASTRVA